MTFLWESYPFEVQCRVRTGAGEAWGDLLLRVIGSPYPYGLQTDGMGSATSSTSQTVILSKSCEPDHVGVRGLDISFHFQSGSDQLRSR